MSLTNVTLSNNALKMHASDPILMEIPMIKNAHEEFQYFDNISKLIL